MTDKFKKINEIQREMDSVQLEMGKVWTNVRQILSDLTQLNCDNGFPSREKEILIDIEAIHLDAVVTGNLDYMQKIGTLLEKYKEGRSASQG